MLRVRPRPQKVANALRNAAAGRRAFRRSPRSRGLDGETVIRQAAFGTGKPEGFKKKFVGKAAGAKGSYKGGKAFRDKRG